MPTRTNDCVNPKLDNNATGYSSFGNFTTSRVSSSYLGTMAWRGTWNSTGTQRGDLSFIGIPTSGNVQVVASLDMVWFGNGNAESWMRIESNMWDSSRTNIKNQVGTWLTAVSGNVYRMVIFLDIPSNAVDFDIFVTNRDANPDVGNSDHDAGGYVEISRLLIDRTNEGYPDYFDGDTDGAAWTGTPGSSSSTMDVPIWPHDTRRYAYFDRGPQQATVTLSDAQGIATGLTKAQAAYPDFFDGAASHGPFGVSFYLPGTDQHSNFAIPANGRDFRFRGYFAASTLPTNGDRIWEMHTLGPVGWEGVGQLMADGSIEVLVKDPDTLSYVSRGRTVAYPARTLMRVEVDTRGRHLVCRIWATTPHSDQRPDYEFWGLLSGNMDLINVGNKYNDGSITYWDSFAQSDGDLIGPFSWDGLELGRNAWQGAATDNSIQIIAHSRYPVDVSIMRTSDSTVISNDVGLAPDVATRLITVESTTLTANTHYTWTVTDNYLGDTIATGQFTTNPPANQPASFRFGVLSCAGGVPLETTKGEGDVYLHRLVSNHPAHENMRATGVANNWPFVWHGGDISYYNPGQYGPYAVGDYRRQWDDVLQQSNQAGLYHDIPLWYVPDDHDYGPNDSDRTAPGRLNFQQAYREKVPHYPLPAVEEADGNRPVYQSHQIGRVLFIMSDTRSSADPIGDVDGPDKTLLGQQQKDWMRTTLQNTDAEYFIWLTPTPFFSSGGRYANFSYEGNELAQMFTDTGFIDKMLVVTGDAHYLAIDDGSGGFTYGGVPMIVVSAMDSNAHVSSRPYSHGVWGDNATRGYWAEVEVQDTGSKLDVIVHGYQSGTLLQSATLSSLTLVVPLSADLTASAITSADLAVVPAKQVAADLTASATISAPLRDPIPVPISADLWARAFLAGTFNVRFAASADLTVTAKVGADLVPKRVQIATDLTANAFTSADLLRVQGLYADLRVVAILDYTPIENKYQPPEYSMFLPRMPDTRRVIVQEILTGEFIEWDLPISELNYEWHLCGSTNINGKIQPEIQRALKSASNSGTVWLHVEEAGQIMASAILQPDELDEGSLSIEAEGFSAYAHGIPYRDAWTLGSPPGVGIDPLDVVREGWRHIQSYRDGDLGVIVSDEVSPIRIGEPKREAEFETGSGEKVAFTAGPYTLDYWENPLIGKEIDKLAVETPFEYFELNFWNYEKTDITHYLEMVYPRIGRARYDLHFEQGVNITGVMAFVEEQYASEVILTGRGEGRATTQGIATTVMPKRIRQVKLVNDKTVGSRARAKAMAQDILGKSQPFYEFKEIEVLADHGDAPLGSYMIGDDILVNAEIDYIGDVSLWHRVVGFKPNLAAGKIVLGLVRTERFIYGPMGRTALARRTESGEWVGPSSVVGTTSPQPKMLDASGNWVPVK